MITPTMTYLPSIIENDGRAKTQFDLPSRLIQDRIVFLNGEVSSEMAYFINMQLMYLDSIEVKDINLYVNSPGGSVYDGLAMYDTINSLKSKVNIVVSGMAASMGAFLLSSGTGIRACTPEARVMIHSVSSGTGGTVHDQRIDMKETEFLQERLHTIMYNNAKDKITDEGKAIILEKTRMTEFNLESFTEFTSRDRWLSAKESIEMGLSDKVVGI